MANSQSCYNLLIAIFAIIVLYSVTDLAALRYVYDPFPVRDLNESEFDIPPTIDKRTPTSIKAVYGQNAYLHCLVNDLGNKVISWCRGSDFYILSTGKLTYTGYVRMRILPPQKSNDWILQIKPIPSDSGMYECQVNTDPKTFIQVNLTTIDPDDPTFGRTQILTPYDKSLSRRVTTTRGHTAYLGCAANDLGNNPVFWSRKMGSDVLTIRSCTYTNDTRFRILKLQNKNEWVLQINNVQPRDSGIYECLVSQNPRISFFTNLTVVETKASIGEDPVIYIKNGSSLSLTCFVTLGEDLPVYVFWQRDEEMINDDLTRDVLVEEEVETDTIISKLFLRELQPSDSGYYTCGSSNAEATNVFVYVLNDTSEVTYDGKNHLDIGEENDDEPMRPLTSDSLLTHLVYHGDLNSFETTDSPPQDENVSQRTYDADEHQDIEEDDLSEPIQLVNKKSHPTQPEYSCD